MILVLNCGSQSIKWKLFSNNLKIIQKGDRGVLNSNNYESILQEELNKTSGEDISTVGHRVVHGGSKFLKPTKITPEVLEELEKLNYLAPLHNPYNILGIRACQNIFKNIPQIVVFDTEFLKIF